MTKYLVILLAATALCLNALRAQNEFSLNGAPFSHQTVHAFENACVVVNPTLTLENAVVIIEGSKIIQVGKDVKIPKNAIRHDMQNRWIYPSFIEMVSDFGIQTQRYSPKTHPGPQLTSTRPEVLGSNMALRSDVHAAEWYTFDVQRADHYRKSGFAIVNAHHPDGIVRGTSVLTELHQIPDQSTVIKGKSTTLMGFEKGSSPQDYPSSLTGAIALLRQTAYDARWYSRQKTLVNLNLQAFNDNLQLPLLFFSRNKWESFNISKIAQEFQWTPWIISSGDDYQRINEIKQTGLKFILPLHFPEMPDVDHPAYSDRVSVSELKHWELAPSAPHFFEQAQVPFAITSNGLNASVDFWTQIKKSISRGLSVAKALEALTLIPAQALGIEHEAGKVQAGFHANFFITNGPVFETETQVLSHWVAGQEFKLINFPNKHFEGTYFDPLTLRSNSLVLNASGGLKLNALHPVQFNGDYIEWQFKDSTGAYHFHGWFNASQKKLEGRWEWNNRIKDTVVYLNPTSASLRLNSKNFSILDSADKTLGELWYPFSPFGLTSSQLNLRNNTRPILISQVWVWLSDSVKPVLRDVLLEEGKIKSIAAHIPFQEARMMRIEGKGGHLTPGIIDEHSHIALTGGVNEGTEASTAEVRMSDVINPEDINIYRQLASGVTAVQLLHGSANPIGGQSAIIKLRWGASSEGLLFKKADPFIKFALGENVKQSNWGDSQNQRFPQTRMGVEQVYRDYFTRAKDYLESKQIAELKKQVFRINLDLESVSEILSKKRFITCHSYVQSEINMLMHLASDFGFKVNTFTHILEGYKVADKMKNHGVYASTFADWWAYKHEVMEALPYNAEILTRMGIITAINSDDAEMGRRLNQEAAKSIKYGGLTETEALKLVTSNPAKILHLDNWVGAITVGKDADLVLWNAHPLSVQSKVLYTLIDGQVYYSLSDYQERLHQNETEKNRIVAKIRYLKSKGEKAQVPQWKPPHLYQCETLDSEY